MPPLGGSSVVDMAKGVAMILAEGDDFDAMKIESGSRLNAPKIPHIAIPTTLSAAEFTSAAGITDVTNGVKELFASATLAARWVILDPEMTAATPQRLWSGTGMKLVADCLEAAHMTLSNLHNVGIGAVAALRHQIGGLSGVPHGEASTIVLPHVMRWNGAAAEPILDRIATDLGLGNAAGLIDRVATRTTELGLPTRLRDVGVSEDQLDSIAEHAAAEGSARSNIRPADAAGLRQVLDAAL